MRGFMCIHVSGVSLRVVAVRLSFYPGLHGVAGGWFCIVLMLHAPERFSTEREDAMALRCTCQ